MPSFSTRIRLTCEVDAEQPFLQILAESVVDGERNDQRGDAGGHSQHEIAVMTPITAWRRLARR